MRVVRAATRVAAAVPLLLPIACALVTSPASSQIKKHVYMVGQPYRMKGKAYVPREDFSYSHVGIASWYGPRFHGRRTANGETYNMNAFTAAHPTLPLSTVVRVTNLANDRSITVRINDRGPYAGGRIIDLSQASARALGFAGQGLARVRVSVLAGETLQAKTGETGAERDDTSRAAATTSSRRRPRRTHRQAAHKGKRGRGRFTRRPSYLGSRAGRGRQDTVPLPR
jgi:rare lipoprotein A (peptidoglycan hydrolase)